jgi:hypothetical protein
VWNDQRFRTGLNVPFLGQEVLELLLEHNRIIRVEQPGDSGVANLWHDGYLPGNGFKQVA